MAQAQIGAGVLTQAPRYAIQLVAFGGIIVLCLVLLGPEGLQEREALGGILPLVGLLAFAGQRLMPERQKLYQSITQMTAGTAALDRVADLTSGRQARLDRTTPAPLGLRHALDLAGVTYAYPGAERPGLRDVGLTIRAGERSGVARALYHDADLVVFGEATSALDILSEAEVMGVVDALPGEKTVVKIAHRLSRVQRCDRIAALDKGRLVGYAICDALMKGRTHFQGIPRRADAA